MFWMSTLHIRGFNQTIRRAGLHLLLSEEARTALANPENTLPVGQLQAAYSILHHAGQLGFGRAQDDLAYYSCGMLADDVACIHWLIRFSQHPDQLRFQNNGGISRHLRDALAYIDSAEQVDLAEFERVLKPACDEGSAHACYLWGLIDQHFNDVVSARFGFLKAAVRGSPEGQFEVGRHYFEKNLPTGNINAADDQLAAQWFQKAADQGHPGSLFFLAMMHEHGRHFPQDSKKMRQLALDSAERGFHPAQLYIARVYPRSSDWSGPIDAECGEMVHQDYEHPSDSCCKCSQANYLHRCDESCERCRFCPN
jgi:hypothetical protein